MLQRSTDMRTLLRENLRGGNGAIDTLYLLEKEQMAGKLDLFSKMHFEPGCSIGMHAHNEDAEIYYVLSGRLTVSDDGVEKILEPGDVLFTTGGQSHWVKNATDQPAEMLAIIMP